MSLHRIRLVLCALLICQVNAFLSGITPPMGSKDSLAGAFGGSPVDNNVKVVWRTLAPGQVPPVWNLQLGPSTGPPTQEPSTDVPTDAPTTPLDTSDAPTTPLDTSDAPTTPLDTSDAPTTPLDASEAPTTPLETSDAPTTPLDTSEAPTTPLETSDAPTTPLDTSDAPTTQTQDLSTDAPSPSTEQATTQDPNYSVVPTGPSTTEVPLDASSTTNPSFAGNRAGGRRTDLERLPDGRLIKNLTKDFETFNGDTNWTRIVANQQEVYVLHPVQTNGKTMVFDPYTIGQVLGYIYELSEFGPSGPPGGFTIVLMNGGSGKVPSSQKRSVAVKSRTGTLIFTRKVRRRTQNEHKYWQNVWK
ncbi:unnamed protein product [Caenorhabditis sp. 36 PRJEB53466]|nr:unnamed protein product [Caenorhabditis sp. 36 PRJEB53466]